MLDIVFCTFYILLFSFIIIKAGLFKLPGLNSAYSIAAFYLKLLVGVLLWYIYAYHYKNRYSSDIFKYFDDGKMMYQVVHSSFSTFLKMVTGIGDSSDTIQGYYYSMKSWINDHNSTFYNNSHFIIRLNALFMFFSGGHYGVHVIFMCFIAFTGLAYLYKFFYAYLADTPKILFAAIFLFPSVLLWSSGILKEGLVFLGLGLTLYYFRKLLTKEGKTLWNLLAVLLGFIILFEAKAYVLLCIIPGLISEVLINKVSTFKQRPLMTYLIVTGAYLIIGLNINLVYPGINPVQMLSDKQAEFVNTAKGGIYLAPANNDQEYAYIPVEDSVNIIPANGYADSLLKNRGLQYLTSSAFCYQEEKTNTIAPFRLKSGLKFSFIRSGHTDTLHLTANDSVIYRLDTYTEPAKSRLNIVPIKPTLWGLISDVPNALVISVIRPFPGEIKSGAVLIYFFENVAILALILFALVFRKKQLIHKNMVAFCLSYCLLMLVLIGISTPLYGGIERYKSVVIPFMLILLLLIYDKDRINTILKRKK